MIDAGGLAGAKLVDEIAGAGFQDVDVRRGAADGDVFRTAEQRQYVMRLMERLSEEERTLLMMKEVDGYSVEELAGMHGMNENTVKVKLFRARQKLMKAAQKNPALRPDFAESE